MLDFIAQRTEEAAPALVRPGGEAMSYGGLAMAAAAVMQALGARVGEVARLVVGVAVEDAAGFLAAVLAVLEAGGVALPLDPRRGTAALQAEAARARAVAVIVGDPAEDRLEVIAGDPARRALGVDAALALEAAGRRAVHGRAELQAGVDAAVAALGLGRGTRLPLVGPLGDAAVLVAQALATLRAGGALLDLGALPAEARAAAMVRLGADQVAAFPSELRALARQAAGLPVPRVIGLGAALDDDTRELLARAFPQAAPAMVYGTAETLPVAAGPAGGPLAPLAGVQLAVDDDGALAVASHWTMLGYLDDAAATRAAVRLGDGARWVRTGDRAEPAGGGVRVVGRLDGTVDVHGERIDPAAVERALAATPGVREAAVLAVADAEAGARLYGFYAGEAAAAPRHPARLVQLESLPHGADGAVDREALRRMATAD